MNQGIIKRAIITVKTWITDIKTIMIAVTITSPVDTGIDKRRFKSVTLHTAMIPKKMTKTHCIINMIKLTNFTREVPPKINTTENVCL